MVEQLSHFPSSRELKNLHKYNLNNAITRIHGGFNSVRNYFNNFNGVKSESERLEEILTNYVEENGI